MKKTILIALVSVITFNPMYSQITMKEAIQQRHSVRNYKETPLSIRDVATITEAIKRLNSESGLNLELVTNEPKAFNLGFMGFGRFSNVRNYIVLRAPSDSSFACKVGYYGEQLVLKSQCMGLNTCWVSGTYKKNEYTISKEDGHKIYGVIAIGYGNDCGKAHKSKDIADVTEGTGFPDWFVEGVKAALLAPTAMNRQNFKISYANGEAYATAPDSENEQISLGIVKCHFEIASGHRIK